MIARKPYALMLLGFFAALGFGLLWPESALAQDTCNGFLSIDYPQIPEFPNCGVLGPRCTANSVTQHCDCCAIPNDVIDIRINLGAGQILGGSFLQLFNFLVGLDCLRFSVAPGIDPECVVNPDGPRVEYLDTVTTNCPTAFLAMPLPVPPFAPLSFEFRADPINSLPIPEDSPNFCSVDFKFRALAPPADSTCTTGSIPLPCCTGAGTGFCQTSDNAACTGMLTPYPCCTGAGAGFCGVSNADCTSVSTPAPCCFGAGIGVCNTGKGSDASCTSGPAPHTCCTGAGTGFCEPKDNTTCTARFVPYPCCTGAGRGSCGDIFQLARYAIGVCDNEGLVSAQSQSAAIPICLVPETETAEFQCHEIPRHSSSRPNAVVSVSDVFGTDNSVTVARALDLCAPVDKNGENPTAPDSPIHLANYALDDVNAANFPVKKNVVVQNQFGFFVVDVRVPDTLLVPTAKSVVPAPPPLPLAADASNHFLCHKIDVKFGPNVKQTSLTLIDQFSKPNSYNLRLDRPKRLCVAASKKGEPIVDANVHMLCFTARDARNLFPLNKDLTLVNQFFNFMPTVVPATQFTEFCAQSTITVP